MAEDLIDRLNALLDKEKELLTHFDYDGVEKLQARKIRLIEALDIYNPPSGDKAIGARLEHLKEKAASVIAVGEAVQEGIVSAHTLLDSIAKKSRTLSYYTQQGQQVSAPIGASGPCKRV